MKSLIRDFESQHNLKLVYPPVPIRARIKEIRTEMVNEGIHLVGLHNQPHSRPVVAFYPGITGWESYYLEDILRMLQKSRDAFVPQKTMFGMSKWEHELLVVNAGSHVYKRMEVYADDLLEICETYKKQLEAR